MASSDPADGAAARTGVERLWETSVGEDLSFLLARANALSLSSSNTALSGLGLKVRSYSVLALAASDRRPTQRELSEFLRLDPSQIVALVDDLESRGLVRREPDPGDRRTNTVVATAAGIALYDAARQVAADAEQAVMSALDDDAQRALRTALQALAGAPRD